MPDPHRCTSYTARSARRVGAVRYSRPAPAWRRSCQRVAQRNRATVRVNVRGIIRQAQLTQHAQRLRGESFIKLDDVHIVNTESARSSTLRVAGTGPSPIRRGSTPAVAIATIRVRGTTPAPAPSSRWRQSAPPRRR